MSFGSIDIPSSSVLPAWFENGGVRDNKSVGIAVAYCRSINRQLMLTYQHHRGAKKWRRRLGLLDLSLAPQPDEACPPVVKTGKPTISRTDRSGRAAHVSVPINRHHSRGFNISPISEIDGVKLSLWTWTIMTAVFNPPIHLWGIR